MKKLIKLVILTTTRFCQSWLRRRSCLVALMLMVLTQISANPVDVNEAKTIAQNFLEGCVHENHVALRSSLMKSKELSLALIVTDAEPVVVKGNRAASLGDNALLYVFNGINNDCFVIVSGDTNGRQVFAYSTTNAFRTDSLIPETKVLLERYKAAVKASRSGASQQDGPQLSNLRAPVVVVEPLVKTQWSQEYPYNYQCPLVGNRRCVTGCTNTAYAQVMNYWRWPKQPTGKVQWSSVAGDYLRMNLDEKPFDWDAMKKTYLPNDVLTDREIDAISYLMAGVGLANGAWFWMSTPNMTATPFENTALRKNFQYHCSEVLSRQEYGDTKWLQYIKKELDASCPILYAVAQINHAVVVDGYDDADNVHVNFGWNGDSDGFYSIRNTNYFGDDEMLINIRPNYDDSEEPITPILATNGLVKSAYWEFGDTKYNYSMKGKCWKEDVSGKEYTPLTIKSGYNVFFSVTTDYLSDYGVEALGICSFNEDGTVKKIWYTDNSNYSFTTPSLQIKNFSNEKELHTISLAYYQRESWHKFSDFPSISFYVEPVAQLGSDVVITNSEQKIYAYSTGAFSAGFSVTLKRVDKDKIFYGDVDVQLYKGTEKVRSWLRTNISVPDMSDGTDTEYTRLAGFNGANLPPGTYNIKVAVRENGTEEFRYINNSSEKWVNPILTVTTEKIPGYERGNGLYITDFRVEGAEHGTYKCTQAGENSYYVKDIDNIPITLTLYNSSDDNIKDDIKIIRANGWKELMSFHIDVKAKESVTLKFKGKFENPLSLTEDYCVYDAYSNPIYDNPYVEYPSMNYVGFYNNDKENVLEQLNDDPVINDGNGLRYGTNNIDLPSDAKFKSYHDTYLKDAAGKIVTQTNWWLGDNGGNLLRLDIRDDVPPGDYYLSINKSASDNGWTLSKPVYDKTGEPLNYPVTLKKNSDVALISDHKNNGVDYSFASGAILVRGKSMPVRYCLNNSNIGTDYEGTIAVFDDRDKKLSDDIPVKIKKKCAEKVFGEIMVTVPTNYNQDNIRLYLKEKDSEQTSYSYIIRGTGNYAIDDPREQAVVEVKDKYVLVRAKNYNLKVGDGLPTISYDCFGLDEGITPVWTTEPQVSCGITGTNAVGVYPVSITAGVSSNISVDAYEGGAIEVNKHFLYATVEDQVIAYGDEFNVDDVAIKYEGFADGDDENMLAEKPKAVLNITNPDDPNDFTSCRIELNGGKSDKYDIHTIDGYLTVNKADQEIIWDQDLSSLESGTVVKLNAYSTSGHPIVFVSSNPDIAYVYTASSTTDWIHRKVYQEQYLVLRDKGEVVITACMNLWQNLGLFKYNYNEAYNPVSKTINISSPVVPKVIAENISREYGDANPEFTYTIDPAGSLVGVPKLTTTATATSPVGTYAITIGKGTIEGEFETVDGKLTITKAPLKITAKDYTIKQGEALPNFAATYEGFKNDETEAVLTKQPTFTTTATSASEPDVYDIIVSGAEALNYDISYVNGKLTIIEADPVTISAKSYTIKYGDDLPAFEYTSDGAEVEGTPEITCEASKTSPIGTYPIVISKGSVSNYNVTYVNGTLTIEKAPLKITAKDYTIKQGEALPTFEATFEGFKNDETEAVLTKQPTFTTTATSASEPGEYDIIVSGAEAQNYEINYVNGKLTITEADGILGISVEHSADVYDLQGNKVRSKMTTLKDLSKGVYIINGRKVLVK